MSDIVKYGELGRYIEATFADGISSVTACTFYLLKPNSTTEVTLTPTSFTETRNGVSVSGYHFLLTATEVTVEGWYSYEVYIETSGGYKGRRECKRFYAYGHSSEYAE